MSGTVANNQVANLQGQVSAALNQLSSLGVNVAGGGGTTPAAGANANAAAGANAGAGANGQLTATIPATGKPEIRQINGQTKYFDAGGHEITAFQYTESHSFKINLDYREGIATGLANLSRIFGARQERVRLLSNALANDANATGSFNPVDLQKMSLETTTTQQLSELQKKIFDSMKDSITAWLR